MKIYEVVIEYRNMSQFILGEAHYIVQADSENDAIDKVVADRSLGSADKDNIDLTATEIDISKPYFVTEV